jgi:hypothetical protein
MQKLFIGFVGIALLLSGKTGTSSSTAGKGDTQSSPVATLSGSSNVSVNGIALATGVPSWPVLAGDQISTGSSPVLITLPDGTELDLAAKSRVTLKIDNGVVEVIVSSGSFQKVGQKDGGKWCWIEPVRTSDHRCGHNDHDADDRCCPSH